MNGAPISTNQTTAGLRREGQEDAPPSWPVRPVREHGDPVVRVHAGRGNVYGTFSTSTSSSTAVRQRCITIVEELGLDQEQVWKRSTSSNGRTSSCSCREPRTSWKVPPFSAAPTRHTVIAGTVDRGRRCARDGPNGMLPGATVTVKATCARSAGSPSRSPSGSAAGRVSLDLPDAVIDIGTHPADFPEDWIVTCDSINSSVSREHVAIWEVAVPGNGEKRDVPDRQGTAAGRPSARQVRYWDYDRPSNTMTTEAIAVVSTTLAQTYPSRSERGSSPRVGVRAAGRLCSGIRTCSYRIGRGSRRRSPGCPRP